jgi:hypothetical protein
MKAYPDGQFSNQDAQGCEKDRQGVAYFRRYHYTPPTSGRVAERQRSRVGLRGVISEEEERVPPRPPRSPSLGTDVAVRVTDVALRFWFAAQFLFAWSESGMILCVPSRFGGLRWSRAGSGILVTHG